MSSKAFIISAVLVAVYAQEHSYSLKTVIKHEQPKQYHHAAPTKHEGGQGGESHHAGSEGSSHGHAVSSQSIVRHDSGHGSHGSQQSAPAKYFTPSHNQVQSSGQQTAHYHQAAPVQHAPVYHAEAAHASSGHHEQDYYAYPKYDFEYKVSDPHTGDNKYQQESRDGDVVKGVYSLHEADGSIRTVEYNSDKHSGFNAYVKHSEPNKHPKADTHYHH